MSLFAEVDTNSEDYTKIRQIAKRYIDFVDFVTKGKRVPDMMEITMDLELVHHIHGLDLDRMTQGTLADVNHDIHGIKYYLDRETGDFEQCFTPRFSKVSA